MSRFSGHTGSAYSENPATYTPYRNSRNRKGDMLAAHALKPVAEHVRLDFFLSQGAWAFDRVTRDVLKVCGGICWEAVHGLRSSEGLRQRPS